MNKILEVVILVAAAINFVPAQASTLGGSGTNPCAATSCPINTQCVVQQVQCIRAPCPSNAQCQPIEEPRPTCETVDCQPGYTCILQEVTCVRAPCYPVPQCVPVKRYTNTCANVRCAGGPCVMERSCPTCAERPRCLPAPTQTYF